MIKFEAFGNTMSIPDDVAEAFKRHVDKELNWLYFFSDGSEVVGNSISCVRASMSGSGIKNYSKFFPEILKALGYKIDYARNHKNQRTEIVYK